MRRNMLTQTERDLVRAEGRENQLWAFLESKLADIQRIAQTWQRTDQDGQLIVVALNIVVARIVLQQQQQQRAAMEPPATEKGNTHES